MSRSLKKMLKHAEASLKSSQNAPQGERVLRYENFLKIENRRLLSLHRSGVGGAEVSRERAAMMDTLLHFLYLSAIREATGASSPEALPMCLVATGGYGRAELNPFSDVDLLFILPDAQGPNMPLINDTVQKILYALWDLRLKVGHATRTIRECLEQAGKDMQSRTSLSETRLLEGSVAVFEAFQTAIEKDRTPARIREYVRARIEDQAQRHAKYGNTVFVQEPNVKSGCGGLRDLQNLLWLARVRHGITTLQGLHRQGILPQIEVGRLKRAHDFLMRVRNQLHYFHGRAVDDIALSIQPKIAEALGYRNRDPLRRMEDFMRDYYRHARDIYVLSEAFAERLSRDDAELSSRRWSRFLPFSGKNIESLDHGLYLHQGLIDCRKESAFPTNALDLLQLFRAAQLRRARLGAQLQSLIRRHLRLVNREFLYSKSAREIFFTILLSKGEVGRILRMMHECGFLGAYIPEFGSLDCLVQHEFYHRYTADEHTLLAIEKLDEILHAKEGVAAPYCRVFQELENVHILYLAILLHDTGKAAHTRHHADASAEYSRRVARRFCLNPESSSTLLWLVNQHMSMSSLVQRRDMDDPSTIEEFKRITGTRQRLNMLHLLTFVDAQAVGSTSWNEWRQYLIWQLYQRTLESMSTSGLEIETAETRKNHLRTIVLPQLPPDIHEDEIEAHFAHMPIRYWRRIGEKELLWHFEAMHSFFINLMESEEGEHPPEVRWRHFHDRGYSEVLICSWDRHGLFAKIAGSFAAARVNILSADIYTRKDNLVLDLFHVCDMQHRAVEEENRLDHMTRTLKDSLSGNWNLSFGDLIRKEYESMRHLPMQGDERFPTTVGFNNEDSYDHTILEIQTPDRLGLLYHILHTLTECDLNIELARINTENGAAMDVFYITGPEGQKITREAELGRIRSSLLDVIARLNAPFQGIS